MSIGNVSSSNPKPIPTFNASSNAKVSDPAHDGDGDDGAQATAHSVPPAGLGKILDKSA